MIPFERIIHVESKTFGGNRTFNYAKYSYISYKPYKISSKRNAVHNIFSKFNHAIHFHMYIELNNEKNNALSKFVQFHITI